MSHYFLISDKLSGQSRARVAVIYSELVFALSRVKRENIERWGKRSASRLLVLLGRRVGGMTRLVAILGRLGGKEVQGLLRAIREGRIASHLGDRTATAIDGGIWFGREGVIVISNIATSLTKDPRKVAPALVGSLLGFEMGSGGLDGNGGIPDLDLTMGIGEHRSLFTHSVIAGVVTEGLLLAFADLAAEIHVRLPVEHDPIWDELAEIGRPLTENLAIGTSAGLAYHLLIDAFAQPAPYHGMPFQMPIESHQLIFAANGITEGGYAASRMAKRRSVEIVQGGVPDKTAGRWFVDAVASASEVVADQLKRRFQRGK